MPGPTSCQPREGERERKKEDKVSQTYQPCWTDLPPEPGGAIVVGRALGLIVLTTKTTPPKKQKEKKIPTSGLPLALAALVCVCVSAAMLIPPRWGAERLEEVGWGGEITPITGVAGSGNKTRLVLWSCHPGRRWGRRPAESPLGVACLKEGRAALTAVRPGHCCQRKPLMCVPSRSFQNWICVDWCYGECLRLCVCACVRMRVRVCKMGWGRQNAGQLPPFEDSLAPTAKDNMKEKANWIKWAFGLQFS